MKLSQIIAYKNHLDDMTPLNTTPLTHDKLSPILQSVKSNEIQFPSLTDQLERNYKNILWYLDLFDQTIEDTKNAIAELIEQNESVYYEESTRMYHNEAIHLTPEYILDRKLPIFEEVVNILKVRIQIYTSWQYASMIIRPGREEWITGLVSSDPLYLLDQSEELLEPSILRFNDQYQRRLRTYVLDESSQDSILHELPDGQFGFCLIYNFFNYKPIEVIQQYLTEIYSKLKPGGVVVLTFNNCDRASGTELFEKKYMSYTPGRKVVSVAESIGYHIEYSFGTDAACTWLELRKPGKLVSLRGGQSLAKVVDNSV